MRSSYLVLLFIVLACNARPKVQVVEKAQEDSLHPVTEQEKPPALVLYYDTVSINGARYVKVMNRQFDHFYCLLSLHGDTVIRADEGYFQAKLIDINRDGYKDIRVYVVTNTPNLCDNYLFDKQRNIFRFIEHCDLDIEQIKGTQFYYSYCRVNCGDGNWESYLSKIEDYKLVNYGYLYGQGCEDTAREDTRVIDIYKVEHNKNKLYKRLPYVKHIPRYSLKWDFMKKYWARNYKVFDRAQQE